MIREFKGASELAILADDLPVRARVCLTLLAADLALHYLQSSPDVSLARDAITLARRWHDGEIVDPHSFEDAFASEDDTGIAHAAIRARSAWLVVQSAILYTAHHAFRTAKQDPGALVNEVNERVLDQLDKDLRALDPSSMALMTRAAAYLRQHQAAPLDELKAYLSRDRTGHL